MGSAGAANSAAAAAAGVFFMVLQFKEFIEISVTATSEAALTISLAVESLHAQHVAAKKCIL